MLVSLKIEFNQNVALLLFQVSLNMNKATIFDEECDYCECTMYILFL